MPETATKKATKGIDFYEFLRTNGFKIPDRNQVLLRFVGCNADSALPVSSPDDITIGTIYKTSSDPVEHGRIEITYWLNAAQIEEVLKLRELLNKNNMQYTEQGDKEIISSAFRKESKRLNSLADRLEGKVQTA